MKTNVKKLLSLLLVLTMVLSFAPTAFAAETEDTAPAEEEVYGSSWGEWDDWEDTDPEVAPAEEPTEEPAPVEEPVIEPAEEPVIEPVGEEGTIVEAVEDLPVADTYPANTFFYVGGSGLRVTVEAPEGAFPIDAEMTVKEVRELKDVQDKIDVSEFAGKQAFVAADITFTDGEGTEIQPQVPVKVNMKDSSLAEVSNAAVLHLDNDGALTEVPQYVNGVLQPLTSFSDSASFYVVNDVAATQMLSFEAESFSTYIIIGEVIIENEEDSFDFETDDYVVTVSYTAAAQIPVGTRLVVSQIPYDSEEYWDLWEQSFDKLNENAIKSEEDPGEMGTYKSIASAVFFDISLITPEGAEFEPAVPLQVNITLKQGGLPQFEGEQTKVIHFGEKGTELIDDVQIGQIDGALGDGMPAGVSANGFTYMQDGFSKVGVFTTDVYVNPELAEPAAGGVSAAQLLAAVRADGDPTINAGKTVTDVDGDGIYELALNIKATSQSSSSASVTKSNVVMVIDVSGSMATGTRYYANYTYNASTYDATGKNYSYYSSSSNTNTRLYYGTYYRWQQSMWGGQWVVAGTGWYSGNQYGGTAYSGTVYAYETRLHATKEAACAVVDALLAYNDNADNIGDVFEISVIKFANKTANDDQGYNGTTPVIQDSTSATAIKAAINALEPGGGTNWEAALQTALAEANYYKNTDPSRSTDPVENTSVIFLTDGFPTFYGNDQGYSSGGPGGQNYAGQEQANNIALCYTNARDDARAIKTAGYTLYNIFAFGSDTITFNNHTGYAYLCALTNYAYGSGNNDNYNTSDNTSKYCFNAKSTDDLVKAFKTIIDHITNNVGFAGVNLTDGVSLGATSTSVAVNGTAKADSMRYSVSDDADKLAYTVKFSNGSATFTIYNADGTTTTLTDNSAETVTTTINGTTITSQVYSVTVGTGDDAKTYKMSPASIDADTGMVKWDLAGLGILESGYTYTVAFDVWPNQLAYDIVADLNNGFYTTIDAALDAYNVTDATERQHIKDAIVKNDDGSYSLYTNYEQSIEYYPATSETDDQGNVKWTYGDKTTVDLDRPDPLPLKGSLLPMTKVWESGLDIAQYNEVLWKDGVVGGTSNEYKITLHLWKADTEDELMNLVNAGDVSKAYLSKELGWDDASSSYIFSKNAAVAPGMMLNVDAAQALGFDTTDSSKIRKFTNDEGTELTYYVIESGHYYYVTEDGSDLHFELDSPVYHPMIVDGTLYNVFFGAGQSVEKMDPMSAVVATNYLKGGLNISKIVTDFEGNEIKGVEDEFAFKITLWKEENGQTSPVYTYDDQFKADGVSAISGSVGYREFDGNGGTLGRDVVIFADSTNAAEKLAANNKPTVDAALAHEPVYATNVGGKTQIILRMPANGEIRLVNLPAGTKYTVEEIVDSSNAPVYTYVQTQSSVKTGDGTTDPVTTTNNTVSGTISGNKANVETYTNKTKACFYVYHSGDNTVEKISFTDPRVKGTFDGSKYTYTFDIANETKTAADHKDSDTAYLDFLYGGYYTDYSGKVKDGAALDEAKKFDDKGWATDEGAKPYTGATNVASWNASNAYIVNGLKMNPKPTMTYYLKEVPANKYLQAYTHYTYYLENHNITKLWEISNIDDVNYRETGFMVLTDKDIAKVCKSLTVSTEHGDSTVKLNAESVFRSKACDTTDFLTYYAFEMANLSTLEGADILQYWVTPDNLLVTSTAQRNLTNVQNADGIKADDSVTVASTITEVS